MSEKYNCKPTVQEAQYVYHLSPSVSIDDPMDRTLREEVESPSSPPQLAAGDFYGNPPVVHGPVYRVDVAIGQDEVEADDDNDLYSDDEEGDGQFEDEEMAYIPSYIQRMLLDESSDLVVRYYEHSVSEVQGLVENDDDDTCDVGEEEEEGEGEDVPDAWEEDDGDEEEDDKEEEDMKEEHMRGFDEYSEVGGFQDEFKETDFPKEEDIEDRRTVDEDESSESSPGDEDHSQQADEWYSGGRHSQVLFRYSRLIQHWSCAKAPLKLRVLTVLTLASF